VSWRFLSEWDVIFINEQVTGAADMLAAPLLLRSAVHRQWAGFSGTELYPELHQKAGALFHGLVTNHAFIDGNKRTALAAAGALCRLNHSDIQASDDDLVTLAVETADQSLPVEVVITRFADLVVLDRR
jgi:death on curing protein